MPVYNPSRAPAPPTREKAYEQPNTEPVYVTMAAWREKEARISPGPNMNIGFEYLTLWYIGRIPDDAVSPLSSCVVFPVGLTPVVARYLIQALVWWTKRISLVIY